ncbi:ras and Rab interactor 2-like [Micropterus salmoides]|uniref:ras and Rab interactor 2-like n=1 Tax=Micropterus salmoides TaxID=27706 RepID=UPI0018EAB24D|nr:ras and Rab interactor 2-like [Micropterus salmoides]
MGELSLYVSGCGSGDQRRGVPSGRSTAPLIPVFSGVVGCILGRLWSTLGSLALLAVATRVRGGYYLTSAYGAMSLIRNFQEEQAARVLSSETRDTSPVAPPTHHQRSAPSIDDFQNYLRVALQELDSGCTAKTLQVRPYATVEEVCQLCALKFKVSDPEKYGLFLLLEGSSQQLAPDTHPQKIKAELHSHSEAVPFHFVFRRLTNSNTSSSTSFDPMPNLNNLSVTSDLNRTCQPTPRNPLSV